MAKRKPQTKAESNNFSVEMLLACDGIATESLDLAGNEVAYIRDLGSDFVVLKPLNVVIEQVDDGDFVAKFPQANVNASGSTSAEAIAHWKEVVRFKFDHYSTFSPDKLGSGPKKHLATLRQYIARK